MNLFDVSLNPLEAIGTLLGLANILLLIRRSIWNFPFGLLMVALYADIFFTAKLYSDALLQLFFFAIQLYGWWAWWRSGGGTNKVEVERLTWPARIAWVVVIGITSFAWGAIMRSYTDAAFPWIDAAVAMASIAAQLLLARRRIENWILWIAVDMVAIGLYLAKGLMLTAGLYVIFLILSALGLREWMRSAAAEPGR
ncbi:MAG TPA: nicotinamide riboside transporter PnuC [Sphingomonas sp.]|nr:nicotinamide riboside transporter PnuC [Sphingomonas sp.]